MPKPFIKWVGGKTQLLEPILALMPDQFETYIEPFIGGGAVFWKAAERCQSAIIGDYNRELTTCYEVIRSNPEELMNELNRLAALEHNREEYLRIRSWEPESETGLAARVIYLNKRCFTAGSQVLLENESYKPIEDVRVGDRVWQGRQVQEVMSRSYIGRLRRIRIQGSPFTLSVTEDHPVLSIAGKKDRQEKRTVEQLVQEINLYPASELAVGDYLMMPTSGTTQTDMDWHKFWPDSSEFGPQAIARVLKIDREEDVGLLLGYFVAEGHITYNQNGRNRKRGRIKSAVWTFNTSESDTCAAEVSNLCYRLFGLHPTIARERPDKNALKVELNSVYAAKFIQNLVPGQSRAQNEEYRKTKRLHQDLLVAPTHIQAEILKGWLRGDGGLRHHRTRNSSELVGTCSVIPLAKQLYRMAQRCGLKPSWRLSYPHGFKTALVSFNSQDISALEFERAQPKRVTECVRRRVLGTYLAVRITDIIDIEYCGTVHNLEVDGDHLICVDGVVSHNCFNGLYRVNKKGKFNVPFGSHKSPPALFDPDNIRGCHETLQKASIVNQDFEQTANLAKAGDVVYFDPPYVPLTVTSNFTGYTDQGFGTESQRRLANTFASLAERGVRVIASNSDTEPVRDLYAKFRIIEVQARRAVNSKGDKRGPVGEVLISSV